MPGTHVDPTHAEEEEACGACEVAPSSREGTAVVLLLSASTGSAAAAGPLSACTRTTLRGTHGAIAPCRATPPPSPP